MIIVRHHEKCAGTPGAGKLTGKCDCKVAPMDEAARSVTTTMIEALDHGSHNVEEDREYLALRYDMLAELFTDAAAKVRHEIERDARKKRDA